MVYRRYMSISDLSCRQSVAAFITCLILLI